MPLAYIPVARATGTPAAASRARISAFGASVASVQAAALDAIRLACDRRITPSSSTLRPLARSVAPVVVMSTISSAGPEAGVPSVAPRLSTMR